MTTVQLKHVHVVRRRLATGAMVEYHYAWKGSGAPRLKGKPGSPEYLTSYLSAHKTKPTPKGGDVRRLIADFKASPEYTGKSAHTKRAYASYLDLIEAKFGDAPFAAIDDDEMGGEFYDWRDSMATTPRKADYALGTLKTLLAWGIKHKRYNKKNQASDIEKLHSADRSDSVWTEDELVELAKHASKELMWAVRLAAYTGLRQGDLIGLVWAHYDGSSFELRTSKRGKTVLIPAVADCRNLMAEIKAANRSRIMVLMPHRGKTAWTADGLRSSFRKACEKAKVKRTFHDLRRTAATKLVAEGHPSATVALIMGWEESAVEALKRKYVSRSAVVESMLAHIGQTD